MKARVAAAAMLVLLTMNVSSAFGTVRISDDRGGQIGDYLNKYHALRENGDQVEIDGTCASACTMLLGSFRGIGSASRPARCWPFTPPGRRRRRGNRSAARVIITCGRIIRPRCASGSSSTAACTRGSFI